LILGLLVFISASLAFLVRFSQGDEVAAREEIAARLASLVPAGAGAGD
jgi:hypothetical protein